MAVDCSSDRIVSIFETVVILEVFLRLNANSL